MNTVHSNTQTSKIDTFDELVKLPCLELGTWFRNNPNTMEVIKDALNDRSAADRGMTPNEVKAISLVLKLL